MPFARRQRTTQRPFSINCTLWDPASNLFSPQHRSVSLRRSSAVGLHGHGRHSDHFLSYLDQDTELLTALEASIPHPFHSSHLLSRSATRSIKCTQPPPVSNEETPKSNNHTRSDFRIYQLEMHPGHRK